MFRIEIVSIVLCVSSCHINHHAFSVPSGLSRDGASVHFEYRVLAWMKVRYALGDDHVVMTAPSKVSLYEQLYGIVLGVLYLDLTPAIPDETPLARVQRSDPYPAAVLRWNSFLSFSFLLLSLLVHHVILATSPVVNLVYTWKSCDVLDHLRPQAF